MLSSDSVPDVLSCLVAPLLCRLQPWGVTTLLLAFSVYLAKRVASSFFRVFVFFNLFDASQSIVGLLIIMLRKAL